MEIKTITTDVLIIGSGGAGCRAAIEVSNQGKEALIVSKGLTFSQSRKGSIDCFKRIDFQVRLYWNG